MSTENNDHIKQGVMTTLTFVVLLVGAVLIPFLNLIVLLLLPLPFIYYTLQHGHQRAIGLGLINVLIVFLFLSLFGLLLSLITISVAIVMGYFYNQQKERFLPLLSGMVTYIVNYSLIFLISFVLFDINLIEMMEQFVEETFVTGATTELLPVPVQNGDWPVEEIISGFTFIFPAMFILSSIGFAAAHHGLSRLLLPRWGVHIEKLPPFGEWNLPRSLLFYYLITLILLLLGFMEEGSTLLYVVINLNFVLEILLLIQGLTFITFYAQHKKWGRAVPIIAVLVSFVPLISTFIRILGILDLGIGLKEKLRQSK